MAGSDVTKRWEGYSESWSAGSGSVTEEYSCAWSDVSAARNWLLGQAHSDYTSLKCSSVDVEMLGTVDSTSGGPNRATLSAKFSPPGGGGYGYSPENEQVSNDWSTWKEHWEGGGEAITVDVGFKWDSDGKKIKEGDVAAVRLYPTATITISGVTDALDSDAKDLILNCMNKVNRNSVAIKTYSYPSNHLLFLSADLDEGQSAEGSDVFSLTYKFAYRHDNDWNNFWRTDTDPPKWDKLVTLTNEESVYSDALFSDLDPANW